MIPVCRAIPDCQVLLAHKVTPGFRVILGCQVLLVCKGNRGFRAIPASKDRKATRATQVQEGLPDRPVAGCRPVVPLGRLPCGMVPPGAVPMLALRAAALVDAMDSRRSC